MNDKSSTITRIDKEEAAALIDIAVSSFMQNHSAKLKNVGFRKNKLYDRDEVLQYKAMLLKIRKERIL